MSISIEHDKRKQLILQNATLVFIENGYQGTTFQKIANRSNVSRTTLYQYFKNKHEIFNFTIKQVTDRMERSFLPYLKKIDSPVNTLKLVLESIMESCCHYKPLLAVLMEYLKLLDTKGVNPQLRFHRRTIRLRRTIYHLLRKAVQKEEIIPINISEIEDLLISLIEAAVLRMVISYSKEPDYALATINATLNAIRKNPTDTAN